MKLSELSMREFITLEVLPTCLGFDYGNEWGKSGKEHISRAVKRAFAIADEFILQSGTKA
jgi:hypothetical protein